MKRLRGVFELTVPEQRVIILILSVLIAVMVAKNYRTTNPAPSPVEAQSSPSPGILP